MNLLRMRHLRISLLMLLLLFGYSAVYDAAFENWKAQYRTYAVAQGIQPDVVDMAFRGLVLDRKVLELNYNQPEFTKPVWLYLDTAVSDKRVAMGQARLQAYRPILDKIQQQYGVQPEYLLAIWGVESDFGGYIGRHNTIRSLATLTYQGTPERREFWSKQLIAALRILQNGDISLINLNGSWAGAIGHTQFIPTTFEEFAVDFDGDGKRNLVGSIPDALASTANYLMHSGWQRGETWGEQVQLPYTFDWIQADSSFWLPVENWLQQAQVQPLTQTPLNPTQPSFVFLPAGYRGPAFLAFRNFQVILQYNNSQTYALAVGYLGDRIAGKPPLQQAHWPVNDPQLSTTDKAQLQQLLTDAGYSTDGIDGKLGPNSRAALRRWQLDSGFPADGYATYEHLKHLKQAALSSSTPKSLMNN